MTSRVHPIDVHVGARICATRKLLGASQADLAKGIGLTFQQVQKYERGADRLSAARLYQIARFLNVPLTSFFEGMEADGLTTPAYAAELEFMAIPDGAELARIFRALPVPHRHALLVTARAIAGDPNPQTR